MNGLLKSRRLSHPLSARPFSSEFKRYFGFEQKLEERKFKNDEETQFSISKMSKVSMLFTSFSKLECFCDISVVVGAVLLGLLNKKRRKWALLWLRLYYLQAKLFVMSDHFSRFRVARTKVYEEMIETMIQ
jgi:hypothetical protein